MTVIAASGLVAAAGVPGAAVDTPGWVRFDGDRIAEVGTGPADADSVVECDGMVLTPGFVDLQVNGWADVDFAAAEPADFDRALTALAGHGCVACLPTFVTAPLDSYLPALRRLTAAGATGPADAAPRATVLGCHLEGPFLGAARGAHPAELLRPGDPNWLAALCDEFPDLVRIVTLAPEADPDFATIRMLVAREIVVSLGHSRAGYDDARSAADAGASMVTHLFNGMGPLHHREPGLPGAALDDARLVPSLIADLVHVHPAPLRLAIGARPDAVLVTDAVAVDAGAVGPVSLREIDGAPRLADGTLAGSNLTMDRAVANVVALGVPLETAVRMATTNPARVLGLHDRGRLAAGAHADVVALDSDTLEVRAVWIAGRRVEHP